ncbi:MAG TPA: Hint domain-containing protein, partial [Coleofasciculaceae cyanobacterium]
MVTQVKPDEIVLNQSSGNDWHLYHGDCIDVMRSLPDDCIDMVVTSIPFLSLFVYSCSDRDLGNVRSDEEFYEGYRYFARELHRIMKPGCLASIHSMIVPTSKERDGHIGLKDFPGEVRRVMCEVGFIFHSEVVIRKDPVTAMQRTKAIGLLHKQLRKDSSISRQGVPDYLTTFRKKGDRAVPVEGLLEYYAGDLSNKPHASGDKIRDSINVWQRYADPVFDDISSRFEEILPTLNPEQAELFYQLLNYRAAGTTQQQWMDIEMGKTLQYQSARDNQDERHVCLARGTLVLTKKGYKPIEDVEIGDLVLTHKGRWKPVIAKQCTGINPVVHVKAQGVPNLILTPDHKLWTRVSKKNDARQSAMKSDPQWVKSAETKGSYVNLKLPPASASSDYSAWEWKIIGRWLADGHLAKQRRDGIYISCGKHKLEDLLLMLGEKAGTVRTDGTAAQVRVKDHDGRLRHIIKQCGYGAANKQLPPEAIDLPSDLAKALLDGYLSGDGHYVENRKKWMATSISRKLLLGLALVIQRSMGVVASVYAARPAGIKIIEGRKVN